MDEEPKMEPTAKLHTNSPGKYVDNADPLRNTDVPELPKTEASELFKLLLSEDIKPKKASKFVYSQKTWPTKVSVGVQCKAKVRDACVGFNGRKNLPIGFMKTSLTTVETPESEEVKNPCCCCMLRPPNSDVRTPYTCDDRTETYMDMFEECFGIELTLETDEECGICEVCVRRLQDARDFKLQVQRSQAGLGRAHIKDEPTDEDSEMSNNEMALETAVKLEELDRNTEEEKVFALETAVKLEELDRNTEEEKVFVSYNEAALETCKQEPSSSFTQDHPSTLQPERHGNDKPHQCHTCHKTFKRETTLKSHMKVHKNEQTQGRKYSKDKSDDDDYVSRKSDDEDSSESETLSITQETYTCDVCLKEFSREGYLNLHKRSHTRDSYTCDFCNKLFVKKKLLVSHIAVHMYGKAYSCGICDKKFKSKYSLKGHRLLHIKGEQYTCKICKKRFPHAKLLKRHNFIHKKGAFVCETCGRQFISLSIYNVHRRIHTGEKPFQCGICNKQFASKGNMMLHERTHTGEKPYSCEFCPMKFICSSALKKHKIVHTKEKSFSCDICSKPFSQYSSLKLHKLIHTGEKPHSCHVCGRKFGRREHLSRHLETHMERKSYVCEYCRKIYTHRHGFAQHVRSHTK